MVLVGSEGTLVVLFQCLHAGKTAGARIGLWPGA